MHRTAVLSGGVEWWGRKREKLGFHTKCVFVYVRRSCVV